MKFFCLLSIIVLALLSQTAFSQTSTPTPNESETVKISTNLIQVDVTVTDKDGKIVTDLKPGDLEIYENGKKQEITNFSFVRRNVENNNASSPKSEISKPTAGKIVVAAPSVKTTLDRARRTYTIVIDDLGLNFASTLLVREALKKFINEQMEAGDLAAIVMTGKSNGALSTFTSNKDQLLAVADKIKWSVRNRSGISELEKIDNEAIGKPLLEIEQLQKDHLALGTLATVSQVISGMRDLPGRKSIVLFSEGFSLNVISPNTRPGSTLQTNTRAALILKQVTDLANRSSVVIYTIDPRGLQNSAMIQAQDNLNNPVSLSRNRDRVTPVGAPALTSENPEERDRQFRLSQESLRTLATDTGGLAFFNRNNIDENLRQAVRDQSGYYLLGYIPDGEAFDASKSKYNKIEIKAVRPDLKIRYRSGFFGITDEKYLAEQKARENNIASALLSPFGANEISIDLTSVYINDVREGNVVQALLNIDAKNLSFTDAPDGGKQTNFGLYAFIFGENGSVLNSLAKTYSIKVSKEDHRRMLEKGFVYFMNVPFKKPGAYQMRIALQDSKTQKVGAANQFIEVPDLEKNRLTLSGLLLQIYTSEQWNSQNASANQTQTTTTTTAIRKFRQGNILQFSYAVYNAKNSPNSNFKSQTRLYRDGNLIYEGSPTPLKLAGNDGKRAEAAGAVGLGKEIVPGDYVLQVIVFEEDAKNKNQIASQSIDFEIVN